MKSIPDVRQSPQFAAFMQDIGWQALKINSNYIYLRKFPVLGNFAKLPRPINLASLILNSVISQFIKKHHIFRFKLSPFIFIDDKQYQLTKTKIIKSGFKIESSPFNPTTTIYINLQQNTDRIFANFAQAKRRAVRRAIKNGIYVKESTNINSFISMRKTQFYPLGFLIVKEMRALWHNFYPKNASLLLAFKNDVPIAGILLLIYQHIAYYWFASSLQTGKKLFAPTLLVWQALKLAKSRGCTTFDFEGIYDTRFPKASESWRGFTKFKQGFGGKTVILCENFYK